MDFVIYYFLLFLVLPLALKRSVPQVLYSPYDDTFNVTYNSKRMIFPILLVSIILGITYETGQDYHYYHDYYKYASRGVFDSWGAGREIGFQMIVEFLSRLYNKPFLLFFVCALVNSIVWSRASSMFGAASSLVMFFMYLKAFTLSMNLYRQYMAMALILLLFFLLITKSWDGSRGGYRKYLPFMLLPIAFCIHTSSLAGFCLLMIPWFIAIKNINKWWWIMLLVISTILSETLLVSVFNQLNDLVTTFQLVSGREYEFADMMDTRWDESRMKYVLMLVNIVYIWYGDKVLSGQRYDRFFYYAMAFYFILTPLTEQEILLRIKIYLILFMAIACGLIMYKNIKLYNIRNCFLLIGAVLVDGAYSLYGLYMLGQVFPLQYKF